MTGSDTVQGMLSVAALRDAVADGRVDTVLGTRTPARRHVAVSVGKAVVVCRTIWRCPSIASCAFLILQETSRTVS